jgi:hypothetical protein
VTQDLADLIQRRPVAQQIGRQGVPPITRS